MSQSWGQHLYTGCASCLEGGVDSQTAFNYLGLPRTQILHLYKHVEQDLAQESSGGKV